MTGNEPQTQKGAENHFYIWVLCFHTLAELMKKIVKGPEKQEFSKLSPGADTLRLSNTTIIHNTKSSSRWGVLDVRELPLQSPDLTVPEELRGRLMCS